MISLPTVRHRLFFGIPANKASASLMALQTALDLDGQPTLECNLHMTLLFLGQVDAQHLAELRQLGAACASRCPRFNLHLNQLGQFPRANVAWIGPTSPPSNLQQLESELRTGCRALGLVTDARPYRPHVTLYRKSADHPRIPCPEIILPVCQLHLYESINLGEGVRYLPLNS